MQDQALPCYSRILKRLLAERPVLVETPSGNSILVLSPHPDDDLFACGGTLIKHRSHGHEITSVYLTDGGKGGRVSGSNRQLVSERESEARAAGELIGVKRQIFLRHKDQELEATSKTVTEVRSILNEVKPDLVYLPFVLDGIYHRDHMETNKILAKAAAGFEQQFTCCAYEVYSPLLPNTLVDITQEMHLKLAAIRRFETQLAVRNYLGAVVSLNRYRALTFGDPGMKFMEAFFCAKQDAYIELLRFVLSGSDRWDE